MHTIGPSVNSDGMSGDLARFLDSLDCPKFTYDDVLACHMRLVAETWPQTAPDDDVERIPIPKRSELHESKTLRINIVREKPRPKRPEPWTQEETEELRRGITRYGWGNWKRIHDMSPGLRKKTYQQVVSHARYLK